MTDIREMGALRPYIREPDLKIVTILLEAQREVGTAFLQLLSAAEPIRDRLRSNDLYAPANLTAIAGEGIFGVSAALRVWDDPDSSGFYNPLTDENPPETFASMNKHRVQKPPANTTLLAYLNGQTGPNEYNDPPLFYWADQHGIQPVRVTIRKNGIGVVRYTDKILFPDTRYSGKTIYLPADVAAQADFLRGKLIDRRSLRDTLYAYENLENRPDAEEKDFQTLQEIFDILEEIAYATHYHGSPIGNVEHYGSRDSYHFSFTVSNLEKAEHYRLAKAIAQVDSAVKVFRRTVIFTAEFRNRSDLFRRVPAEMFAIFVKNHCEEDNYRELFLENIFQRIWNDDHRRVEIVADPYSKKGPSTIRFSLNP